MQTKVVKQNGVPYIAINGEVIDTLAFKSFRPTANNVSDFYKAGIRIFHVYVSGLTSALKVPYSLFGETWFGDGDYRFEALDEQIKLFADNAPDAHVFINVHLDTRQWWLDQNPGRVNSFTHLSQVAADEKWRKDTAEYLKALIRHVEEYHDDRVLGYFLLGGYTTEWFSQEDKEASHPCKLEAYRKYRHDPNAEIPAEEVLIRPEEQIFLDPVADKELIAYRKFHNELISDPVLYFCHAAQEEPQHKKVLGVFFGYIMELMGPGIWNRGHLDNDRVYNCPDIDLIATPSSYQFRSYDDAGALMILSDSLELNGKMYFDSFDHMTFMVPKLEHNTRRICGDNEVMKAMGQLSIYRKDLLSTREKTIDGIRREFMQRLSRRCGMWWFDMLEGWFYDDNLMAEVKCLAEKSAQLMKKPRCSSAQIAVFVSCESLYYVNKASKLNTEIICNQRDALARMGAPYDLYSFNDIARVGPEKYQLYIFLDALYLTDSQRTYINGTLKQSGKSLLLIGACDYVSDENVSLERVSALADMEIGVLKTDEARIRTKDSEYGYAAAKNPTMYVRDENVEILGTFAESGCCALARKTLPGCTIYYSALGNLSHTVLRKIARESGVHIYAENGVATYVNSGFVGVYNTRDAATTVILPEDGTYTEFFSGKTYTTENKKITLSTGKTPAHMLILP